jgi:hypothetical protein
VDCAPLGGYGATRIAIVSAQFLICIKYDNFEGKTRQGGENYIWNGFSYLAGNWGGKALDIELWDSAERKPAKRKRDWVEVEALGVLTA